eukprot:7299776-Pyramimonas_sp.AAC.1
MEGMEGMEGMGSDPHPLSAKLLYPDPAPVNLVLWVDVTGAAPMAPFVPVSGGRWVSRIDPREAQARDFGAA